MYCSHFLLLFMRTARGSPGGPGGGFWNSLTLSGSATEHRVMLPVPLGVAVPDPE